MATTVDNTSENSKSLWDNALDFFKEGTAAFLGYAAIKTASQSSTTTTAVTTTPTTETPWYAKQTTWIAVGAAVGAIVLIKFALSTGRRR